MYIYGGVTLTSTGTGLTNTGGVISVNYATQADQETSTSLVLAVPPGRQQFHPSAVKAAACATQSAGTYTLRENYNVASLNKTGVGLVEVLFTVNMSGTNYIVVTGSEAGSILTTVSTKSVNKVLLDIRNSITGANLDNGFNVIIMGDQ